MNYMKELNILLIQIMRIKNDQKVIKSYSVKIVSLEAI